MSPTTQKKCGTWPRISGCINLQPFQIVVGSLRPVDEWMGDACRSLQHKERPGFSLASLRVRTSFSCQLRFGYSDIREKRRRLTNNRSRVQYDDPCFRKENPSFFEWLLDKVYWTFKSHWILLPSDFVDNCDNPLVTCVLSPSLPSHPFFFPHSCYGMMCFLKKNYKKIT